MARLTLDLECLGSDKWLLGPGGLGEARADTLDALLDAILARYGRRFGAPSAVPSEPAPALPIAEPAPVFPPSVPAPAPASVVAPRLRRPHRIYAR